VVEFGGVKETLAQTQAAERVQEGARRQGEQQQQSLAVRLDRQADLREHQVNAPGQPEPGELDPDARRQGEDRGGGRQQEKGQDAPSGPAPPEQDRGRHIDVRA